MRTLTFAILLMALVTEAGAQNRTDGVAQGLEAMKAGNYAEAYCRWKPLAQMGNPDAQYNLGWLYANGNGMRVDATTAVYWWREAARRKHVDAQLAIALAYMMGEGVDKDEGRAVMWYISAAKRGSADAQEIVIRLAGEQEYQVLEKYPEIAEAEWFVTYNVVRKTANIRQEPDIKSERIAQLAGGTRVKLIASSGDWRQIQHQQEGNTLTGWIHQDLLDQK